MKATIYLQLPSDLELLGQLDRHGMAICYDTQQALRFAQRGVRVVRKDKVGGGHADTELSAESLHVAIDQNWEMRG